VDDVTSTVGIVALAAAGCAVVALAIALVLAIRIHRVRAAQRAVLGEGPPRDLAEYARHLERQLAELREHTDRITDALGARAEALELGLEGAITHAAVVRYDAYNEMSGMQSSSVALLDDRRNGVVLSSILHREQARLYAKPVVAGRSDFALSPEEEAAVEQALGRGVEIPTP
jgi:Protein of unknown function (DUF4446)